MVYGLTRRKGGRRTPSVRSECLFSVDENAYTKYTGGYYPVGGSDGVKQSTAQLKKLRHAIRPCQVVCVAAKCRI